jgi:hypothetical protein
MQRITEKLKCNPFTCLGINLTILSIFFGLATAGYFNLDQKITKVYTILIEKVKIAKNSPQIKDSLSGYTFPYLSANR